MQRRGGLEGVAGLSLLYVNYAFFFQENRMIPSLKCGKCAIPETEAKESMFLNDIDYVFFQCLYLPSIKA